MILAVNTTILTQPRLTGLGVHTVHLLRELLSQVLETDTFDHIELIGHRERLLEFFPTYLEEPRVGVVHTEVLSPIRRLIELNRLVRRLRRRGPVLVYSPTHHGVIVRDVGQVITIHDLFARLYPANYRKQFLYFRYYLPLVLDRCYRVLVDSGSTAHHLRRFYRLPTEPIRVSCALRTDFGETDPIEVAPLVGKKYFLFVGPSYRYKNCDRLIDAFDLYRRKGDAMLAFVGGRSDYVATLKRHVRSACPHLVDQILFLDYVDPGELIWLYRHATALMLTTLCEGFGLPALEAMQCECPVVASDAGSLPEVCGEAAYFVDPRDIGALTEAMTRLAEDRDLVSRLRVAGKANLKRFGWEKSAREVLRVLNEYRARVSGRESL